jgi:hypothetical protein
VLLDQAIVPRRRRVVLEGSRDEFVSRIDEIESHYLPAISDEAEESKR